MTPFKILIVDDEEVLREILEITMHDYFKCQTFSACHSLEAIEILKLSPDISLIISDNSMPVAKGSVLFEYNIINGNRPFYLLSGGDLRDYKEFKELLSINTKNRFFSKPYDEEELLKAISELYQLAKAA